MMVDWQDVFSKDGLSWQDGPNLANPPALRDLEELQGDFWMRCIFAIALQSPIRKTPRIPLSKGASFCLHLKAT